HADYATERAAVSRGRLAVRWWRAVRCYGGGVRMCPKPQHGAIPACLIPKIVAICPVSNQDPKPIEIQDRSGKEAVPLADLFVKPPYPKALLVTSAMLWSHWCQGEPVGAVTLAISSAGSNAMVSWPYPHRGFGL